MDNGLNSTVSEESVRKAASGPAVALGLLLLLSVAAFALLSGNDEDASAAGSDREASGPAQPEPALDPVSTVMTLATGPDTAARSSDPNSSDTDTRDVDSTDAGQPPEAMPDRGAFREALAATLVSPCDGLIDGPEPISAGLYREHGRCVSEALVGLDERCRLAAAVFYVLPSDEALDVACDIQEEPQGFRESVRQSMVLTCDLQRDVVDPRHEAYYEYDRCLLGIEEKLDDTCFLAAKAQFYAPEDTELREVCEIAIGTELSAGVE